MASWIIIHNKIKNIAAFSYEEWERKDEELKNGVLRDLKNEIEEYLKVTGNKNRR